jgi:hypothetical protein
MELFLLCFAPGTSVDYDVLMNLLDLRDWWLDNVGEPPSTLSVDITAKGFTPFSNVGAPAWPLKYK